MHGIGRYRVLAEVARGGMGAVFRAESPEGRPVALKLLLAGRDASEQQRRRFAIEAQSLARLRHPGVIELLEAGEHQGVPFLALEWVDGESLATRLARDGPLDPRAASELVRRLAEALEHCHERGVLHRDLTPGNVLLRAGSGEPLLTDFGLAKDLARVGAPSAAGTVEGQLLGTPAWWPPEQARGQLEAIGRRSDVYGLGALLYAALTGRPPQRGETLREVLTALERPPVPPGQLRPGVPSWLDALCLRALDAEPTRRPDSAGAFAALLTRPTHARGRVRGPPLAVLALLAATGGAVLALRSSGGPVRAPAPGAPAPADELGALLAEADRRAAAGDAPGTLLLVERILEREPDHAGALTLRGAARRLQGDLVAALDDYDKALARDPSLARAWAFRGGVRFAQGDPEGGLEDLDRALALDPRLRMAWINRSTIRQAQGDWAGAMKDAERAVALQPDDPVALTVRGLVRLRLEDAAGARDDLDRAVASGQALPEAIYERGNARQKLGDAQGALEDYDRALALAPGLAQAWHHRGNAHVQLGEREAALQDYARALELDPRSAMTYGARSLVRETRGELREALADVEQALALQPDAVWADHARARRTRLRATLGLPAE